MVEGEPGVDELQKFGQFGDVAEAQWDGRIGHGGLLKRLACLDVYCGVFRDVVRAAAFCRFC
jgi:hypothetical protein